MCSSDLMHITDEMVEAANRMYYRTVSMRAALEAALAASPVLNVPDGWVSEVLRSSDEYRTKRDYENVVGDHEEGDPESIIACVLDQGQRAKEIMSALADFGFVMVERSKLEAML